MNFLSVLFFLVFLSFPCLLCCREENKEKPAWTKKDIRDYNDADLERLYDQWEEDDEPLEPDELPEHLRSSPQLDFSKLDTSNPENILKLSKKGRTLMAFVSVTGNPTKEELDEITKLWQTSLMNNHINIDRFVIDSTRAIFMFKDGSQAWDAKDFLIEQDRLEEVVIENKPYYGKNSLKGKQESSDGQTKKFKEEL